MPLSFTEINAYIQSTQTPLTPDEVYILREMSESYCKYINSKDPSLKSPEYKDENLNKID